MLGGDQKGYTCWGNLWTRLELTPAIGQMLINLGKRVKANPQIQGMGTHARMQESDHWEDIRAKCVQCSMWRTRKSVCWFVVSLSCCESCFVKYVIGTFSIFFYIKWLSPNSLPAWQSWPISYNTGWSIQQQSPSWLPKNTTANDRSGGINHTHFLAFRWGCDFAVRSSKNSMRCEFALALEPENVE